MAIPMRLTQLATHMGGIALAAGLAAPTVSVAQVAPTTDTWQACAATADGPARLQCFDRWAQRQQPLPGAVASPGAVPPSANIPGAAPVLPATTAVVAGGETGCNDGRYSNLSRFWELERSTDCGIFELRGYRPIALSVVAADRVNRQPTSPAPGRSALTAENYRSTETRIQLSARVKVARNLLTDDPVKSDSLWVGYSQQSHWQFFTGTLSRPFRTTDYEPEAMYVYPSDFALPFGWRMRYSGVGISHQSNGRQLPASRSWNRAYLMGGMELDNRFSLEARLWKRLSESNNNDNPDIVDFMGRGELTANWNMDARNTLAATVRHNLRDPNHGSVRLERFHALGTCKRPGGLTDLRLPVNASHGYGESMIDYNVKRNTITVGMALVDS